MPAFKLVSIVLITCVAALLGQVESKATLGIGRRIAGDQLLLKDVLQARSNGIDESATIRFSYAIPEPITYIEILSEENVLAEVNFSYQHELVKGIVAAINTNATKTIGTFNVLITIYGLNETVFDLYPANILNRYQNFEGYLQPQQDDENLTEELDDEDEYANKADYADYETNHSNNYVDGDDFYGDEEDMGLIATDFDNADKIIEVGRRQQGDYLIYETMQTSTSSSLMEAPRNHSVVFYYIDRNFITYAEFVIHDHYIDKSINDDYIPPIAEYTHYSPNTLKAIITDHNRTSLIVQMFLYGYFPMDLPDAYAAFLQNSLRAGGGNSATPTLKSSLQRLDMLMKQREDDNGATTNLSVLCLEHAMENDAAAMSVSFLSILSRFLPMGGTASGATFWSAVISLCLVGGVGPPLRLI